MPASVSVITEEMREHVGYDKHAVEGRNGGNSRKAQCNERTRAAQRLEKVLQDAGVKLSSVASNILGKSGRAMLDALAAGTTDPPLLAELALGRLRPKLAALTRRWPAGSMTTTRCWSRRCWRISTTWMSRSGGWTPRSSSRLRRTRG